MTPPPPLCPEALRRALAPPPGPPVGDALAEPGLPPPLRPAAVLCALVPRDGALWAVLTVRPETMRVHAGQIAFPGGKVEPADPSPLAAALREAREEIGLEAVEVLGGFEPYATRTGFMIAPFVGLAPPGFSPRAQPGEVAEVFEAPLDHLMDLSRHRRFTRTIGGARRSYWAIPWRERFIWGATAGMLRRLAERVAETRTGAAA